MSIAKLSNEQLLASLRTVVGDERRLVAQLLALLGEVEERRIHLKLSFTSMYDFCTRQLGLSEDQACRRIAVARLGRRFPQLIDAISNGRMHLSGVYQLRELWADTNVEELIEAASGKSRAEIDRLIAKLAPKPDVPESIRRLPEQTPLVVAPAALGAAPSLVVPPAPRPVTPIAAQLMPLSEERFCITLTVGAALEQKIEKVRALTRHRNPTGDLAWILERAIDVLIEQTEKELRATTKTARKSRGRKEPGDIASATRRAVYERDAGQCTFVSADGVRCPAREFLELDHRHARALGGAGDVENVRILCRAHNQLAAEEAFGRKHMDEKRRGATSRVDTGKRAPSIPRAPAAPHHEESALAEVEPVVGGGDSFSEHPPQGTLPQCRPATSATEMTSSSPARDGTGCLATPSTSEPTGSTRTGTGTSTLRPPREGARFALIRLGFRSAETDRALETLPPSVWSQPLEAILRAAIGLLT